MTVPASDPFAAPEYRSDGRDKVSGRMQYTADVRRTDALWAAFVESPHAYARIVSIDVRAARAIDGVRAVLTADDIGRPSFGRSLCDWPVLAVGRVRFPGDRVVAVAAETPEIAEAATRAVVVTYEPLAAVLDPRAATEPGAPVLHPDWEQYTRVTGSTAKTRRHPNAYATLTITKGEADLEPIFASAFRVFRHEFETPRQHAGFIEPRATLVWIDGGIVHVHSPNKTPFTFRRQFAHVTGIPESQIVVEPSAIGGDFGGKGLTVDELPCYYLARATGRPVRYVTTYDEELRRGPTRHRTFVTLRSAIDRDGTFLAHVSSVLFDGGAYAASKPIPTLLPGNAYGAIPYRVPNVRIEIEGVYTNTLPGAHVRGPADLQTFTAWERHVDVIARSLAIDPLDFRLKNVVGHGDTILTGEHVEHPMAREVLEAARREPAAVAPAADTGRGVSLVCAHMGSGNTSVRMRLDEGGVVRVLVGAVDQGTGIATVVRRVVSTVLSIDPERIVVQRGNTADALPDPGSGHSRVTHIVGRAALDGAEKLRARLEAGERAPIEVVGSFTSTHGEQVPADLPFAACVLDVQVDRETGAFCVRDALLVADVGAIINPVAHRGQMCGAFIFGLGNASTEEVRLDEDGRVTTSTLGEYKLPTVRDVPPLRTVHVRGASGDGPFGARMIGELCNLGIPAALMNALDDAVGVKLSRFPVRAEDVYAALRT